jgi:hypothetical protein
MDEAAPGAGALILRVGDDAWEEPERPDVEATLVALEASRQQVERSLGVLREEADRYVDHAKRQLDWRAWVQQHPWKVVGVGFVVGAYLGMRD